MASQAESTKLQSYWREIITDWQNGEQTQKAYCQAHDLNYHQFGYWRRRLQELEKTSSEKTIAGFAAVRQHRAVSSSGLSVTLPNGLVVQGIETDNLSVVYQLLRHLS